MEVKYFIDLSITQKLINYVIYVTKLIYIYV